MFYGKCFGKSLRSRAFRRANTLDVLRLHSWSPSQPAVHTYLEALHPGTEICHINEGHAAFAIVERARSFAVRNKLTFWQALWATRAGNVFTTHTPVAAGFDAFPAGLLRKYVPVLRRYLPVVESRKSDGSGMTLARV
jgi:glucan phosphorylase